MKSHAGQFDTFDDPTIWVTDIADRGMRLPSERFHSSAETITRSEWLRRHALTYGGGGSDRDRESAVPNSRGSDRRGPVSAPSVPADAHSD